MMYQYLKKIRVGVSVVFFCALLLLFIDISNLSRTPLLVSLTSLQFMPALMTAIRIGTPIAGLIAVVLLTVFAGRVYCSSICPLGTLQDGIIALSRKTRGPRKFKYAKAFTLLHYAFLAAVVILFLAGSVLLLDFLDPYSFFGRIAYALLRPGIVGSNNGLAWISDSLHLYLVYAVPFHTVAGAVLVSTAAAAGILFWMAYFHGRLFCNSVCPTGAVLRLLSRVSLFRLTFNHSECKDCSLCEKLCKAECIDYKKQDLDFTRCVSCFNCIDACPTLGIQYSFRFSKKAVPPAASANPKRRQVLKQSAALLATAAVVTSAKAAETTPASQPSFAKRGPVTPPGSVSAEHFTGACTSCYLCVAACPSQVIAPSFLDYGVRGMLQPKMDYSQGYCAYDCSICTTVCPSGALRPLSKIQKKEVQLGRARFIKDDCIVITKKTDCGACSEHCPTKAVQMVKTDGLFLPKMTEDLCVGCGACEHACPVKPNKAIFVEASVVHGKARKPEQKIIEEKKEIPAEFPF
jgi:ferredoxin